MSKSIELYPDWKRWFWGYFFGILLIPLFGIGLFVLYRVHKKRRGFRYNITDRQITATGTDLSQTVDLANVKTLDVEQNWFDKRFGIGDVKLHTETRSVTMLGQKDPQSLSDMISKAIFAEKKRIEELKTVEEETIEPPPPGTLDKLDYLTGLWQQGLLSDEDFREEKKKFEDS